MRVTSAAAAAAAVAALEEESSGRLSTRRPPAFLIIICLSREGEGAGGEARERKPERRTRMEIKSAKGQLRRA